MSLLSSQAVTGCPYRESHRSGRRGRAGLIVSPATMPRGGRNGSACRRAAGDGLIPGTAQGSSPVDAPQYFRKLATPPLCSRWCKPPRYALATTLPFAGGWTDRGTGEFRSSERWGRGSDRKPSEIVVNSPEVTTISWTCMGPEMERLPPKTVKRLQNPGYKRQWKKSGLRRSRANGI